MKQRADEFDLIVAEEFIEETPELSHIRVRRRVDLLILESGDPRDPVPHARVRRLTSQSWRLEMPMRGGRWDPTPFRDDLTALLQMLHRDFPWMLTPIDPQ